MKPEVIIRKPLGRKAYGSIPHLIGSRRGEGDHGVNQGQHNMCVNGSRNRHVHVQEKLDGSCVAVAKVSGEIVALNRAGYRACSSPFSLHHDFGKWVDDRRNVFSSILGEGERLCGEWLGTPHGTDYEYAPLFVAFDCMVESRRLTVPEFQQRFGGSDVVVANVLASSYCGGIPIEDAVSLIGDRGQYGAFPIAEGVVYRVECDGEVELVAKYVRPEFVPMVPNET